MFLDKDRQSKGFFDADAHIPVADMTVPGKAIRWTTWVAEELSDPDGGSGPYVFMAAQNELDTLSAANAAPFPSGYLEPLDGAIALPALPKGAVGVEDPDQRYY